jgi:hypothetical protein
MLTLSVDKLLRIFSERPRRMDCRVKSGNDDAE